MGAFRVSSIHLQGGGIFDQGAFKKERLRNTFSASFNAESGLTGTLMSNSCELNQVRRWALNYFSGL